MQSSDVVTVSGIIPKEKPNTLHHLLQGNGAKTLKHTHTQQCTIPTLRRRNRERNLEKLRVRRRQQSGHNLILNRLLATAQL
jgi:hypothetical protein